MAPSSLDGYRITVCIAHIPTRVLLLERAMESIRAQTLQPAAVVVEYDHDRTGAAATKNRALAKADTEYVSYLDDDDEALPRHLELMARYAKLTGADVVYPWPEMRGNTDPRPDRFGVPFDPDELRRGSYIPTVSLIRRDLLVKAGGFQCPPGSLLDDWGAYLALLDLGAVFAHLPRRTWIWNIHPGNTSGQPDRW